MSHIRRGKQKEAGGLYSDRNGPGRGGMGRGRGDRERRLENGHAGDAPAPVEPAAEVLIISSHAPAWQSSCACLRAYDLIKGEAQLPTSCACPMG